MSILLPIALRGNELVLEEATQQGQQIEYGNNYDYAGEAAPAEGESSTSENKWNKNGIRKI